MSRGRRIFVLGVVAVLTVPLVYVVTRRGTGEPLTPERLAAARALWKEKGPKSYALEVDVGDARDRIEVKDGKVVAMTSNGGDVPSTAWEFWNVEGMFKFLSEELSNLQRPEAAFGVSDPDDVVLRAEFHERYGYPVRFLRHVLGQDRSVEWDVRLTPR